MELRIRNPDLKPIEYGFQNPQYRENVQEISKTCTLEKANVQNHDNLLKWCANDEVRQLPAIVLNATVSLQLLATSTKTEET